MLYFYFSVKKAAATFDKVKFDQASENLNKRLTARPKGGAQTPPLRSEEDDELRGAGRAL